MRYAMFVLLATAFVGCTNTHRLVMLYESADAVRGTLQILESDGQPLKIEAGEKQYNSQRSESNETPEDSVLTDIRKSLP